MVINEGSGFVGGLKLTVTTKNIKNLLLLIHLVKTQQEYKSIIDKKG